LDRTEGKDSSENWASNPGLLVRKIERFHSQMQLAADGTPEVIEAPAPRKRAWGVALLIPMERTKASAPSEVDSAMGLIFSGCETVANCQCKFA
jgi:hypothetical protein